MYLLLKFDTDVSLLIALGSWCVTAVCWVWQCVN